MHIDIERYSMESIIMQIPLRTLVLPIAPTL